MKQRSRKITFWQWCRRYFSFGQIAVMAILVYILCFTDSSVGDTYKYEQKIAELEAAIKVETDSMKYYQHLSHSLSSDPEAIEGVAREFFRMQRPSEDVYVFK